MTEPLSTTVVTTAHKVGAAITIGGFSVTLADVTALSQAIAGVCGAVIGVWTLWDMICKWLDKRKKKAKK
jgi:hypothetical protein